MRENTFDRAFTSEALLQGYSLIKKMIDGEEVGINPLKEIPKSQMTLYGINGMHISKYFDTEEELETYLLKPNSIKGPKCKIEYLGFLAGKSDVIKITCDNGEYNLYTTSDEDGYGIYNENRSIYTGTFVWEYNYGSLREEYQAFKERGITLENDLYGRLDEFFEIIKKLDKEETKRKSLKQR